MLALSPARVAVEVSTAAVTEHRPDSEAAVWHTAEEGENTFIFIDLFRLDVFKVIK